MTTSTLRTSAQPSGSTSTPSSGLCSSDELPASTGRVEGAGALPTSTGRVEGAGALPTSTGRLEGAALSPDVLQNRVTLAEVVKDVCQVQ